MNMLGRLRSLLGREKGEGKETKERQTQSGLPPPFKTTRKKWSRRWYRASKEPPLTPTRLSKRQVKHKVESLTTQLQVMTAQRNDLRDRLILVTEGSLDNSDLQSWLLMEQSQLKKKLDMLRQEKENLLEDWVLLKQHLGDLQVLSKDQEESSDLQKQQQEEQQRMEERLQSLLKQKELVTQQKNLALKLQHLLTVSQMRPRLKLGSEKLQHELEQSTAQDESLLTTELLQQEH
ncbi:uncharacterized protein LOC102928215 [Peromyscus maniculatus bairdii]|uniref:uncharacterized protein LOC102928215 n=1 Tax=Peromyscus maniculatus bairdii TaxID=230844 RepID=UPI003FD6953B